MVMALRRIALPQKSEDDQHTRIVDSYVGFLSSITSRQRSGVLLLPVGHLIAMIRRVYRTDDPSDHGTMVTLKHTERYT